MSIPKPCHLETLAHNSVAHIQRCASCGCVSVHIGAITVRIDDSCLEALISVLGEAAIAMHLRGPQESPRYIRRGLA